MMIRTQIQLTPEQSRRLKLMAARKGLSVLEVIRKLIDTALLSEDLPNMDEIKERARSLFGKYQNKATDVSENPDQYLSEAFSK